MLTNGCRCRGIDYRPGDEARPGISHLGVECVDHPVLLVAISW
jgi:hypothetical protein